MTTPGGGCPCEYPQDPQPIGNLPGLDTVSYRADDFTGFRRALLRALPGETALDTWAPASGDLGLQVLEWWAYLADILTLYDERIANESYLRTATQADSLANLVALLGFQPAPGVAATGQVAALRGKSRPHEPLVVPAGMPIGSTASAGVPAQVFEVTAAAEFGAPSDISIVLPPDDTLPLTAAGQPASVLLAGRVRSVKAGERLLLIPREWAGGNDQWAWVTVASSAPEIDPNTKAANTRVTFTAASTWGPTASEVSTRLHLHAQILHETGRPSTGASTGASTVVATGDPKASMGDVERTVDELRGKTMWVLGGTPHQAEQADLVSNFRLLRPSAKTSLWDQGSDGAWDDSAADGLAVHLAATVRTIEVGELVLFDGGSSNGVALASVGSVSDDLRTVPFPAGTGGTGAHPAIVVPHTVLGLDTQDTGDLLGDDASRTVVRYGFRDVGTLVGTPATQLASLPVTVGVPHGFTVTTGGTQAFCEDANGAGVLVEATSAGDGFVTLAAVPPAGNALDSPLQVPLRLLVDLIAVSRGKTVPTEVLGNGDASALNQTFTLKKSPLTYLADGAGYRSTLRVYVNGIQWIEVGSLYDQPPTARVFVVERAADHSALVRFGDGVNGARLPSGTGNVVATYRYGSGAASPPAGRLTTMLARPANLASIHNPVAVSGGADPQSPDDVRRDAPASVFTFGRAISAVDYEVVAGQAPGVTRASARWSFDPTRQRSTVTLYVGDDDAAVASAARALAGADDPNRPIAVVAATAAPLSLTATVVAANDRRPDDVLAAATAALTDRDNGPFSPRRRGVGRRLYRSEIDAALMVSGAVAVRDLSVMWWRHLWHWLSFPERLDELFDPEEGTYFTLPAQNIELSVVSADG